MKAQGKRDGVRDSKALHTHMIGEQPRTFFMHFWGVGTPDQVAGTLKKAVDLTKSQKAAAK